MKERNPVGRGILNLRERSELEEKGGVVDWFAASKLTYSPKGNKVFKGKKREGSKNCETGSNS